VAADESGAAQKRGAAGRGAAALVHTPQWNDNKLATFLPYRAWRVDHLENN
jgi:hypothetical protein